MFFAGIQKTTLLDYPGKVASTVFTYGCNFRCPFCHNPELVIEEFLDENKIPEEEILEFLFGRVGKLDGLVITGGEPLINDNIIEFIYKAKDLGYLVKVDTNGSFPGRLKRLIDEKIVDYLAMDIKNSLEQYIKTIGLDDSRKKECKKLKENIIESMSLITSSAIDYEFRTTIVPGLHTIESVEGIGRLIKGSKKFCIQNFRPGKTISNKYSTTKPFSSKEIEEYVKILSKYVANIEVRGI